MTIAAGGLVDVADIGLGAWTTLTPAGVWVATETIRAVKIGQVVYLQGVATAGAGATQTITTLPPEMCPVGQPWRFLVLDTTTPTAVRFAVQTSGVVQSSGAPSSKSFTFSTAFLTF